MKKIMISMLLAIATTAASAQQAAKVYLTREITPEALVKIYKALGVEAKGRVAVKVSTGEGSNPNYLKPELIKDLVLEVDGTIVECNTAYGSGAGNEQDERNTSANHWKVIERHGFLESMAAAAQAVVNYFNKKQGIIYINVMNNMSMTS